MSITAIENALHTRLNAMPPGIDVAWPGLRFEPSPDTPYMRPQFEPLETALAGQQIGSGPIRQTGLYVVRAFYPMDDGPGPLRAKAQAIFDHFPRGLALDAGTAPNAFKVRVETISLGPLREGDGWNSVGVTARWLAFRPA